MTNIKKYLKRLRYKISIYLDEKLNVILLFLFLTAAFYLVVAFEIIWHKNHSSLAVSILLLLYLLLSLVFTLDTPLISMFFLPFFYCILILSSSYYKDSNFALLLSLGAISLLFDYILILFQYPDLPKKTFPEKVIIFIKNSLLVKTIFILLLFTTFSLTAYYFLRGSFFHSLPHLTTLIDTLAGVFKQTQTQLKQYSAEELKTLQLRISAASAILQIIYINIIVAIILALIFQNKTK